MNQAYIKKDHVRIKKEKAVDLAKIDAIIFDIDGVLVNVDLSYYQTIQKTVQFFLARFIPQTETIEMIDQDHIKAFKSKGGFNDDFELAAAALLYYIWKMKEFGPCSMETLKKKEPLIPDFLRENIKEGKGIKDMVRWIKCNASCPEAIFSLWKKDQIIQIAREFYSGEKYCFPFYQIHPHIIGRKKGFMESERILIQPELKGQIKQYKTGIITGRNHAEADFILKKMKWDSLIPPANRITAEYPYSKPSPKGLNDLMNQLKAEIGLYIGDSMDDLLMVNRYRKENPSKLCFSALIMEGYLSDQKSYLNEYLEQQVDIIAENVNQVIALILHFSS